MDRSYWRLEPTSRLIEEARTKGCELCRALGERLEDAEIKADERAGEISDQLSDVQIDYNQLEEKFLKAQRDNAELELLFDKHEARIAELEAALKIKKKDTK